MARAKTSPFVLSNTVMLTANGATGTATIDLGSYVDVSSKTGIAIHSVDCVFQNWDSANNKIDPPDDLTAASDAFWVSGQVFDQTRDTLQLANDNSLVGSATLEYDGFYITSYANDVYPDSYPTPGRLSISPQLTLVARTQTNGGAAFDAGQNMYVTFRITAELVKLSEKDWMGIAIQGQALNS
jgi:hypothetical protein